MSKITLPLITVLMSVYNGEKHLREAVESVLNQTYGNFEFLIIDDCSTDLSLQILLEYSDPRIKQILNNENIGLTKSLNKGILLAKGKYIARMDADDICNPRRLEKQVAFLEKHSDISICGSWIEAFSESRSKIWKYPVTHDLIHISLLFKNVIAHPSVMVKKICTDNTIIQYDESYKTSQDFELWSRLLKKEKSANIPDSLLKYRLHKESVSISRVTEQEKCAKEIILHQIQALIPSARAEDIHLHLVKEEGISEQNDLFKSYLIWLQNLAEANKLKGIYPHKLFINYLTKRGIWLLKKNRTNIYSGIRMYKKDINSILPIKPWIFIWIIIYVCIANSSIFKPLLEVRRKILHNR